MEFYLTQSVLTKLKALLVFVWHGPCAGPQLTEVAQK